MALVSVVVPVHNAGRYLQPSLDSLLAQTYRDIQIICVDDGSTDGSAAVLEECADRDSRIQLVRQPHGGPGSARNAGLARAAGDYLMFVDADDQVPPAAVQSHLDALRRSTSDFSTGRVERLTGTYRWPSAMHDNALARAGSGAHLYRSSALLFDTTSWNKLFRHAYWIDHRYAFPEGVLFEDVAVMTEAHCRAASVEVVSDVVYWWRRRDDGTLSVTMRRDDPDLLGDRVASLQSVRQLLADIAPGSVRQAAETKFLRHDLGSYFQDLEQAPAEFQHEFVRRVAELLADSPARVVERLPPRLRAAYGLVARGRTAELVEFMSFLREHGGRLPVCRRWLLPRVDLGPAGAVLPRAYASALRRMPLRISVSSVHWETDTLVIEGYGFIDGVPLGHPLAALRRLRLVDSRSGLERHIWLRPRRLPTVSPSARMSPSYEWSGFRAEIPPSLLDPDPDLDSARWQVSLQVLAWGAASGSALGPPQDPTLADVHCDSAGLAVRVLWSGGTRLVLDVARAPSAPDLDASGPPLVVTDLGWSGENLRLELGSTPADQELCLAWSHGSGDEIHPTQHRSSSCFDATFDLLAVPGPDGVRPLRAGLWALMARESDGSWRPVRMSRVDAATGERQLGRSVARVRIGPNAQGYAVMLAEVLPPLERSAIGQERLQRGAYRMALRSSVSDSVLFEAWGGKSYSDSPRALLEAASRLPGDQTAVVAVADRSIATPPGVRVVLAGSRDHHEQRARAGLIISNDCLPGHFAKRAGQRYLQTWHGTPLKQIGLDIDRIRFRNKNYQQELSAESAKWDWLISPNAYSTEIFRRAFAYEGLILETGYPRNDLLAGPDGVRRAQRRDHARRWLGIAPDQHVVLWAPTWRDDAPAPGGGYGPSMLIDPAELEALLPGKTVVLFRGHHLFSALAPVGRASRFRNVSGYPDLRDLVLASDALVTDYSSLMFDYALTGKPMVFYAPDLLHYQQVRGLYLDLVREAPGPVVLTSDGLADALRSLSDLTERFGEELAAFRRRFCALEDGGAADRVWAAVGHWRPS